MFEDRIKKLESELEKYISNAENSEKKLIESMRYSLLMGGKRIRPILCLEFCLACGSKEELAMPFACSVEMIHTYSLIHDDLPCMDNSDLRRGKPANHIIFGEALAVLAGDALLTLAFEILGANLSDSETNNRKFLKCVKILSECAGASGMVGGQSIDLKAQSNKATIPALQEMYKMKTGKLILAAAQGGCVIAGADDLQIAAANRYAENIGLAFQIVDDILDNTSNALILGKPAQNDKKNAKSTHVTLLGLSESTNLVRKLTNEAVDSLKNFKGNTENLENLALDLAKRTH
ncbi:MAG: polyprenyl synthetase family protein [Oscillospiraceae bacterium]|nr:polyprenyl synthetase family protein [Oscillospiraceae bacterium]